MSGRGAAVKDRLAAAALALVVAAAAPAAAREVRLDGYAEWHEEAALVVDGQRVVLGPRAHLEVKGPARTWDAIPLGYEMKVSGDRLADGTVRARRVEARPNGSQLFEAQVLELTGEAEEKYRIAGEFFQDEGGKRRVVGRLHDSGPQVERVRAIVGDILPPYVDPARVHVYVIDNREWNAFALGNYAIYVFSGLLDDLDDDELAIVLGHELVHATHEHTRRQFRKAMWIQLAAVGVTVAAEEIDNKWHRAVVDLLAQFAALAWANGYGRDLEDQADRVGLRYAWEAGYDVTRGPALWERFARRYGDGNRLGNFFLADHAQSRVRSANLRRELALNSPRGRRTDGPAATPARPG